MKNYSLPYGIKISVDNNHGGTIESELVEHLMDDPEVRQGDVSAYTIEAKSYANALESFLLALACEGYDMNDPRMIDALDTVIESMMEDLKEEE